MSRGIFYSNNKVGEVFTFQTNVNSGSTFDPVVSFVSGSDRVSWDLGNGKLIAGNSLVYTFTGDTGTTKTIKLKTNRLRKLKQFQSQNDNIIGQLDMTKWSNFGGSFQMNNNPGLTGITHTASTQIITNYIVFSCNLTGNLNLSMLPNLGASFQIYTNPNLTGVTHTASTQVFTQYYVYNCGLKGNYDLSMFSNLGGSFRLDGNINLTGVTHTSSNVPFNGYFINSSGLVGNFDLSMLNGLGGNFRIYSNSNLTGIIHPQSTQTFVEYYAYNCNLDYVDFKPLSGATFKNIQLYLYNNNMLAADVNHILDDFKNIVVANTTRWSGVTLNIGGTNQDPDSSSGGYDGLSAISTLTGSPYNWNITY